MGMRLLLVVPLIALVGCVDSPPNTEFPATSAFPNPTIGSEPLDLPELVEVTEPCPESAQLRGDGSALFAESSRLEPTSGIALAYGGQWPDEFGTYGLVWHSDSDASVFISFTGRLDEHRSALADIVEFPDEVIVCQVALPGWASQALSLSLTAELAGRFLSVSQGGGPVEIVLPATEETLAGELVDRYQDAVRITVGVLRFPIADAVSVCSELVGDDPPAGLDLAISPLNEPLVMHGPEPLEFEIQLTNLSDASIQFNSGIALGTILDATGNVVGSSSNISTADVAAPVDLAPGASTTVGGVLGLASCDPRLGFALPPGAYQLVGSLQYNGGTILTPPLAIIVA